jgi:hypothetical protein
LVAPQGLLGNASSYWGFNPGLVISNARDKVDALVGLSGLLLGFLLQITGHLAQSLAPSSEASFTTYGFVFALYWAGIFLILWWKLQPRLVRDEILKVCDTVGEPRDRQTLLITCLKSQGHLPEDIQDPDLRQALYRKYFGRKVDKTLREPIDAT